MTNTLVLEQGITYGNPPTQEHTKHFAEGFNFYKCFWVFLIGSLAGFLVETIFCLVMTGHIAIRSNLICGPLNTVYGMGALALYMSLHKMKKHIFLLFIIGAVVGTAVEYFCSWGQQMLLGSVSWDYSNMPLNINGRVCLLFSVYWGFLAVAWVKWIQPFLEKVIAKIPNHIGKPLTWLLCAALIADILLTVACIYCWNMRVEGASTGTYLATWIECHYPNSLMENIYNNMIHKQ